MTQLASSSTLRVRIAQETSFGEVPTAGNHKVLPLTGESLTFDIEKTASEEINPDRGVSDMVPTSASASGGISIEMKASVYDDLMAAGMQGVWEDSSTDPIEVTVDTNTLTTTDAFPVATLKLGQFIGLHVDSTSPNYLRLLRISSEPGAITAQEIKLDTNFPAEAETLTASYVVASRLRNGTERRSFSIEKEFSDAGVFRMYRGMNVSGFSVSAAQGAISNGEFTFMGRDGMKKTNATQMPGTALAAIDSRAMTGMTGSVCGVWIDGLPLTGTFLSSTTVTLDNNMRQQNAMCSLGAVGIGNGSINVTGSLEIYFANADVLYDEFVENRNVELAFTAFDTEGNGYVFTLPKSNINSHTVNSSGNNNDVLASVEVTGLQVKSGQADLNGVVMTIDRLAF